MQLTFQALPALKGTLRDRIHCPELGFTLEVTDTRKETFDVEKEVDPQTVCFFSPFTYTPFEETHGWYFTLLSPPDHTDLSTWNTDLFIQAADSYLRKYLKRDPLGYTAEPTGAWEIFEPEGDWSEIWPELGNLPNYTPEQISAIWENTNAQNDTNYVRK